MFTGLQLIAVAALMLISFVYGLDQGRKIGASLANYYREKWLRRDPPLPPDRWSRM